MAISDFVVDISILGKGSKKSTEEGGGIYSDKSMKFDNQ